MASKKPRSSKKAATKKKVSAKKTVSKKKVAAKKPASKKRGSSKKAPAKKAPPRAASRLTTIIARVDAGFGNQIFLRGEGAGLSWEKGVEMENVGASEWRYVFPCGEARVEAKCLLNDADWAVGTNFVITPGETVVVVPRF